MILTKSYKNKEIHYADKIITTDGHVIHFEVKGDPLNTPVVFLHGGPGARVVPAHYDFFNPKLFSLFYLIREVVGSLNLFVN